MAVFGKVSREKIAREKHNKAPTKMPTRLHFPDADKHSISKKRPMEIRRIPVDCEVSFHNRGKRARMMGAIDADLRLVKKVTVIKT
jgi:hypothetical protein